jgi:hypothetical protein
MAGLKWNTGKLYYSTVELGYQHNIILYDVGIIDNNYYILIILFYITVYIYICIIQAGLATKNTIIVVAVAQWHPVCLL